MNKFENFGKAGAEEQEIGGERRLSYDRAMEREEGLMEKLRGKGKTFIKAMLVVSAISFGGLAAREASAAEGLQVDKGETVEEFEEREASQERAIAFLQKLMQARGREGSSAGQQRLMAQEAARVMIQGFAAQEKSGGKLPQGESVAVGFRDVCKALDTLNSATGEFADRYLGNKDGKVDGGDMAAIQKASAENPGLKTFIEMSAQCR